MHGLTTQIITSAWSTLIDCVAFAQWFYCHCITRTAQSGAPDPAAAASALHF
jgi:hypothetical protein